MNDEEAKALGYRFMAACSGMGAWEPWRLGVSVRRGDLPGVAVVGLLGIPGKTHPMAYGAWSGPLPPRGSECWPDLRDAATMGAALALWQARPGHIFRVPCPVLTCAAAHGLTDPRTIRALVDAMEAKP